MSLGFPSNPQVGDIYALGTQSYIWDGIAWTIHVIGDQTVSTITSGTGTSTIIIGNGSITINSSTVITSSTIQGYVVGLVSAGTDTTVAVTESGLVIWNTSTLQTVTDRGTTTTNTITISNNSASINTTSGALQVVGGAGIGGDARIGGNIYSNNALVLTTSSVFGQFATGTDIMITTNGQGIVYVSNISTLQSVTDRGSNTSNVVRITNTSSSTSTTTGALQVSGGVGIGGSLNVGGNINIGNGNALTFSDAILDSNSVNINTTATTLIDSYSTSLFRSAKYLLQVEQGTGPTAKFSCLELIVLVDNNGFSYPVEYGYIDSGVGVLGDFATDVVDNFVQLYFTSYYEVNTVITLIRTAVTK